jgi:hypothetical protein
VGEGADVKTEDLPPTQFLVLEVLAARYRLGENVWTFPTSCMKPILALEAQGLVWHKSGTIERTRLVGLTKRGRSEAMYSGYRPPGQR